jgi:hypothetical protein
MRGLQTYRILNFVVGSFVLNFILLGEGTVLRDLAETESITVEDYRAILLIYMAV